MRFDQKSMLTPRVQMRPFMRDPHVQIVVRPIRVDENGPRSIIEARGDGRVRGLRDFGERPFIAADIFDRISPAFI